MVFTSISVDVSKVHEIPLFVLGSFEIFIKSEKRVQGLIESTLYFY